jgi:hypothetical protein
MGRALMSLAMAGLAGCLAMLAPRVELHLQADGTVACSLPGIHGCAPLLVIAPAASKDREPTEDDPFFDTGGPTDGIQPVLGSVRRAPETLAPGEYRLVGWIGEVNDIAAGPGQTMNPYVSTIRGCATEVSIPEAAISVEITVHYDASGSCEIDVAVSDQPD